MSAELDQKGFWLWFVIYFAISIALTVLWNHLAQIWLDDRPLWVMAPIGLLLLGPHLSIYVRRLRHAGRSGKWVFCLLALYAVELAALPHYQHRLDMVGAELKPMRLHPIDESSGNVETLYAWDIGVVQDVGAGVLTGLPGLLQLIFAVLVGRLKPRPRP